MSYLTQARLAKDQHIMQRLTACAATQNTAIPSYWVQERAWQFSAQPLSNGDLICANTTS